MKHRLLHVFALALAVVSPALAQSYSFTTIAGLPSQLGSIDGAGSNARFNDPFACALDSANNVYVCDAGSHVIRKITPAGVVTTLAGRAGESGSSDGNGSAARFSNPLNLAVDSAGNVFVCDYDNSTIRKITPAGEVSTFAGLAGTKGAVDGTGSAARLNNPSGIAIDASGTLYVADWANRNIRKITPSGVVSTFAGQAALSGSADGTGTSARFSNPAGIALDGSGNLYVADATNHTVRKISPDGVVSTLAGLAGTSGTTNAVGTSARFNRPLGIAVHADGTVYVSDTNNDSVRKITGDGTVTTFAGTSALPGSVNGIGTAARFYRNGGIAIDPAGNFYVADAYNQTIRKITSTGVVTDFAGPGGNFGFVDGNGTAARFNLPSGMAFDRSGNILVADTANFVLRRVTPSGSVTTIAGKPGVLNYVDGTLSAAVLGYPSGVAVDKNDNIYVVDEVYSTVRQITPSGNVFTVAGRPLQTGTANGAGSVAQFTAPSGIGVADDGTVYVADTANHAIRKITPDGVVTTFAGLNGTAGSANGASSVARFRSPQGVAVDRSGNVYVTDTGNQTIRKITPDGTVSTIAGLAGVGGSTNGNGSTARFQGPFGVAVDASGNLFVADADNHTVRKITPDGTVSTIGGLAGTTGNSDGAGSAARFFSPVAILVDDAGILYVLDVSNNVLVRGELERAPAFTIQPQSLTVSPGSTVVLSASATGGGLSYQWKLNGVAINGATSSTFTVTNAQSFSAGSYTLEISNSVGKITSQASLAISNTPDFGRISNLAIRAQASTGAQTLIVGIAVGGSGTTGTKPILIRGVGPTLTVFNVSGALNDPLLSVYQGSSVFSSNDNWAGNAQVTTAAGQVGAFAFASTDSKDAALYNDTFAINSYTVQITDTTGAAGVALAEIYDATPGSSFTAATPRLTNVSARTQVGTGGNILIAGFVIGGSTAKTVLIRATGPALSNFGVFGVLNDPKLEVIRADSGVTVAANDNWGGGSALVDTFAAVGAFPLDASGKDAALRVTLPPGGYTAQVSGVNATTGVALIEVYEVP